MWPSTHPNLTRAVSDVIFSKKIIPVFCRSRPAVYMFGFSVPNIVCAVAQTVIPLLIAFFIFGSQLNFASCAGTCPIPVISRMIPV